MSFVDTITEIISPFLDLMTRFDEAMQRFIQLILAVDRIII